jgi:hypothetical protein
MLAAFIVIFGLLILFFVSGGESVVGALGYMRTAAIVVLAAIMLACTPIIAPILRIGFGLKPSRAGWVRLITFVVGVGLILSVIGLLPDNGAWRTALITGMLAAFLGASAQTPGLRMVRNVAILITAIAFFAGFGLGWARKEFPSAATTGSTVTQSSPSSKTIFVTIPPGQERVLNSAEILPGGMQYRVNWPQLESGRAKVYEGNHTSPVCEDWPGNTQVCLVDAMNEVRFENVSNEETRFYYTVIRLK